jgi:plasmid maintenance system antidote protein VapI
LLIFSIRGTLIPNLRKIKILEVIGECLMDLRSFLATRDISQDGARLLDGVDGSTISRIVNGQVQARPRTVVKLAKALGVSARRMQGMCEAQWLAAHPDEWISA